MFRKFLALTLTLFTFFTLTPALLAHEYKDVPQGSGYYYPVDYLRRNNVFKDTAYFYPDTLITKAEFIKYLVALNSPDFKASVAVKLPFQDTRDSAWYAPYFKEAIKLGILDDREKKVEPTKKITLVDALTLLFHSQSIPIPHVYKGDYPYTDLLKNKQLAPLVMRALELDIISPQKKDYVGIYQRVTRAQAARMIYKMDLVTLGSSSSNGLPQVSTDDAIEKITTVWNIIQKNYLRRDTIDKNALVDSVLKDMVKQLNDPYSVYFNQEENKAFLDNIGGQVEGIGAVIGYNDQKEVIIVSPIKGSPAENAGILAKDVILSVDDQDLKGKTLEEIVSLIKGPKGTTVKLKIRRGDETKEISVKRDIILIPSVKYETIDNGDIMHLTLSQFNNDAGDAFQKAITAMKADSNIKGLVIDLRGDPGGLLSAAVSILGHYVPAQKEVVTIKYTDANQVLLSPGKAELNGFPTVVLIDNGSASASEIVAGALQDYKLAKLIGEQSFGKGTVQEVNYFLDNSSLKLTVAKWYTPNHQSIQDGGITPDVKVTHDDATPADEVLDKGVEELKKLMK